MRATADMPTVCVSFNRGQYLDQVYIVYLLVPLRINPPRKERIKQK